MYTIVLTYDLFFVLKYFCNIGILNLFLRRGLLQRHHDKYRTMAD